MYKANNNFKFFQIFILFIFVFNTLFSFAAEEKSPVPQASNPTQEASPSQSNLQETDAINDDELPESDITTKIYRSTDSSNEVLDEAESELDPSLDVDVLSKEDLIHMQSSSKSKIIKRIKAKNEINARKPVGNVFLPWISFAIILIVLFVLMRVVKKIKI